MLKEQEHKKTSCCFQFYKIVFMTSFRINKIYMKSTPFLIILDNFNFLLLKYKF